jgi:hypothetical protein
MQSKHPGLRLSREEKDFLRHWMYDEMHYLVQPGAAKRLQLEHGVVSADLALLIAAGFPDIAEQEAAGLGPPPEECVMWSWSEASLHDRLIQARATLAERNIDRADNAARSVDFPDAPIEQHS